MKKIFFVLICAVFIGLGMKPSSAQQINEAPQNGLYKDDGLTNKKPIPYSSLRRADVMWQKRIWRVVTWLAVPCCPFG